MNARMSVDMSSSFSHCSFIQGHGKAPHAVDRECSLFAYLHADTRRRGGARVQLSVLRRTWLFLACLATKPKSIATRPLINARLAAAARCGPGPISQRARSQTLCPPRDRALTSVRECRDIQQEPT